MYTLVYDFETSGLNPFHDDVIEIGCKCLETDEELKNTEALKKSLEHLEIIKKDTISIFEKNNIKAIIKYTKC